MTLSFRFNASSIYIPYSPSSSSSVIEALNWLESSLSFMKIMVFFRLSDFDSILFNLSISRLTVSGRYLESSRDQDFGIESGFGFKNWYREVESRSKVGIDYRPDFPDSTRQDFYV